MSADPEGERVKFVLKPKDFERVNSPSGAGTPEPIAVREILQHNQQVAGATEKPPDLTRRPSRRKRDYFLCLALGNGLFVALMLLLSGNVVTLLYGFSGIVLFSVGLTWVMWAVMDDY